MSEEYARNLRARYAAAIPDVPVDPAPIVQRGRRRRRLTRLGGAVAAGAAVIAVVIGVLVLRPGDGVQPATTPPPAEAPGPFSLWLSAEQVPPGGVELVAVLVNHEGGDATFGVPATVERWDGGSWNLHRRMNVCLDHWHCTATMYPPGAAEVQGSDDIGIGATIEQPGPVERFSTDGLEPGWYRVSQEAYGGAVARGVFQVVEGAPTPAPLWPTDVPAISVQPAVVRPGRTVTLTPLVPSKPDGSLSYEDIEAVVEDLGTTASVERWDGSAWGQVADIALEPPSGEQTYFEMLGAVPDLEPGSYRLVRSGPGGEHTGNFWVAGAGERPVDAAGPETHDAAVLEEHLGLPPQLDLVADVEYAGAVHLESRTITVLTTGSSSCPSRPTRIDSSGDGLLIVYIGEPGPPSDRECTADDQPITYTLAFPDGYEPTEPPIVDLRWRSTGELISTTQPATGE